MATRVIEDSGDNVVHEHRYFSGDNGIGYVVGITLLVVLAVLFIFYGIPYLRNATSPQVTVPERVDVNVNNK